MTLIDLLTLQHPAVVSIPFRSDPLTIQTPLYLTPDGIDYFSDVLSIPVYEIRTKGGHLRGYSVVLWSDDDSDRIENFSRFSRGFITEEEYNRLFAPAPVYYRQILTGDVVTLAEVFREWDRESTFSEFMDYLLDPYNEALRELDTAAPVTSELGLYLDKLIRQAEADELKFLPELIEFADIPQAEADTIGDRLALRMYQLKINSFS